MNKENNGWISVEDRLPELNDDWLSEPVLMYIKDNNPYICVGWLDDDKWTDNDDENYNDYITHWQPLPQPPKEG